MKRNHLFSAISALLALGAFSSVALAQGCTSAGQH